MYGSKNLCTAENGSILARKREKAREREGERKAGKEGGREGGRNHYNAFIVFIRAATLKNSSYNRLVLLFFSFFYRMLSFFKISNRRILVFL